MLTLNEAAMVMLAIGICVFVVCMVFQNDEGYIDLSFSMPKLRFWRRKQ
jgi:hypothetical protein